MAIATYTALNSPYVSQQKIIGALQLTVPSAWNIPIYDEFPSDTGTVRFGLYVSNVITTARSTNQLAIQYCGAIYNATDTVIVNYVSFQNDPYEAQVCNIVGDLVTDNIDGVQLMDGYFERTYNQNLSYGPTRAAIHTWTINLTRLEFNT
jgi:hypothetical protein